MDDGKVHVVAVVVVQREDYPSREFKAIAFMPASVRRYPGKRGTSVPWFECVCPTAIAGDVDANSFCRFASRHLRPARHVTSCRAHWIVSSCRSRHERTGRSAKNLASY